MVIIQKHILDRPNGISSRARIGCDTITLWIAPNGCKVPLPIVVDHLNKSDEGQLVWLIEATIDLVDDLPQLTEVSLKGIPCLDPVILQSTFRWATPVEIVRITIPELLAVNIDPFSYDFSTEGYPDTAKVLKSTSERISDEFLLEIYQQYLEIGAGYAKEIAAQRGVSPRTVVNWIEKGRKRGLIPKTQPGKMTIRSQS